jgi:amino acid transporter
LGFALLGVRVFGETEFWFTLAKLLALAAFFLCAILISTGVIGGEKIGFKYYHDPGPFGGSTESVFQVFVFAALQYSGTEMVGLSAGESNNPSKDVPKAVKNILIWRIIGIFLGGVFFVNIAVPWNDPNLLHAGSKTASSPFVNAIILVTLFSALNGTLYVGSRTLYGLAQEGAAPRIFLYTTNKGVPIVALVTINLIGFLSLLNLSSGAGTIYAWIVSMIGLATFITCKYRFSSINKRLLIG